MKLHLYGGGSCLGSILEILVDPFLPVTQPGHSALMLRFLVDQAHRGAHTLGMTLLTRLLLSHQTLNPS